MGMNQYRVKPGQKVDLKDWDPQDAGDWSGKKEAGQERLLELREQLAELQAALYAEHKHRLLIIFQAMDSGGKDGTIRAVFEGVNPQGVRVASFKAPTPIELDHDYLWRIHAQTPGRGEIVVFNRSQYEDVLVVRVHNLVPEAVWSKRYDQINAFEKTLADEGTTILKFYLHISLEEQKQRFIERLEDPTKLWKFNPDDIEERKFWPEYMKAFEAVLSKTSTDYAPWYIIPANRNWYRNLVVSEIIVKTLEGLKMKYPEFKGNPDEFLAQLKKE